jgi:hypothetical protein
MPISFYHTGSRFLNSHTVTVATDYDFFTDQSPADVQDSLFFFGERKLGHIFGKEGTVVDFIRENRYYGPGGMRRRYRWVTNTIPKIDVFCLDDYEFPRYKQANDILKASREAPLLTKKQRVAFYDENMHPAPAAVAVEFPR